MQTIVYLVRHGEVNNPDNIIYGRLPNFGLTEKGIEQLTKTAEFLKKKEISELFSSPMHRAEQSATIIQRILNLDAITIVDQINEVRTSYQGQLFSDLDNLQSEIYLKPLYPTDETIEQIAKRMQDFLTHILKSFAGKHIVAVSHGDPIMVIKTIIEGKPLTFENFKVRPYIQHGEVYQISSDGNTLSIQSVFNPSV
jgi:broad specificity phosphatase PhoE